VLVEFYISFRVRDRPRGRHVSRGIVDDTALGHLCFVYSLQTEGISFRPASYAIALSRLSPCPPTCLPKVKKGERRNHDPKTGSQSCSYHSTS